MLPTMASPLPVPIGTSISGRTTQPLGVVPNSVVQVGVEKNFSPQKMLAGDAARTVRMDWIMVAQRSEQRVLPAVHGSALARSLVMEPERSKTRSRSAGTWVMVLASLPQFTSAVGAVLPPP